MRPWASTSAPTAVMWLFPSLGRKTEERLRQRGGAGGPCKAPGPGPGRGVHRGMASRQRNRDSPPAPAGDAACAAAAQGLTECSCDYISHNEEACRGLFCKAL